MVLNAAIEQDLDSRGDQDDILRGSYADLASRLPRRVVLKYRMTWQRRTDLVLFDGRNPIGIITLHSFKTWEMQNNNPTHAAVN